MNRCKTLVGLPCVRALDEEAFELRARMVRLPCPEPRVTTHTRLRLPEPEPRAAWLGGVKEFAVSAAVVFLLGCIFVGWFL